MDEPLKILLPGYLVHLATFDLEIEPTGHIDLEDLNDVDIGVQFFPQKSLFSGDTFPLPKVKIPSNVIL